MHIGKVINKPGDVVIPLLSSEYHLDIGQDGSDMMNKLKYMYCCCYYSRKHFNQFVIAFKLCFDTRATKWVYFFVVGIMMLVYQLKS